MDTCFLARIALRDRKHLPNLMSQLEALDPNERFIVESGLWLKMEPHGRIIGFSATWPASESGWALFSSIALTALKSREFEESLNRIAS
jgi:hypothetical protein